MIILSPSEFESSRVNCSSFLLARDHSHITSVLKYTNFTPLVLVRKNNRFSSKIWNEPEFDRTPLSLPPDDAIYELSLYFSG